MTAKVPPIIKGCDRCCETVQPNTGRHCPNCQMNFCERCCDEDNYIECECHTRGRPTYIRKHKEGQNPRNPTEQYVTNQESQQRGEAHCHAMHWAPVPDLVGKELHLGSSNARCPTGTSVHVYPDRLREMNEVTVDSSHSAFQSGIAFSREQDSCDDNC
jgi:hypothetical protein